MSCETSFQVSRSSSLKNLKKISIIDQNLIKRNVVIRSKFDHSEALNIRKNGILSDWLFVYLVDSFIKKRLLSI